MSLLTPKYRLTLSDVLFALADVHVDQLRSFYTGTIKSNVVIFDQIRRYANNTTHTHTHVAT